MPREPFVPFPCHPAVLRLLLRTAPGEVMTSFAPAAMNLNGCGASDLLLGSPWGTVLTVPTLSANWVLLGQTIRERRLTTARAS